MGHARPKHNPNPGGGIPLPPNRNPKHNLNPGGGIPWPPAAAPIVGWLTCRNFIILTVLNGAASGYLGTFEGGIGYKAGCKARVRVRVRGRVRSRVRSRVSGMLLYVAVFGVHHGGDSSPCTLLCLGVHHGTMEGTVQLAYNAVSPVPTSTLYSYALYTPWAHTHTAMRHYAPCDDHCTCAARRRRRQHCNTNRDCTCSTSSAFHNSH